jgi:ribosomal protein S18 acetylase RimI-like enzyme
VKGQTANGKRETADGRRETANGKIEISKSFLTYTIAYCLSSIVYCLLSIAYCLLPIQLTIRNATLKDIPLIRDLTFKVWPQTYSAILTREQIDYMLELIYSEASLQKQMNDNHHFIIVHEGDSPVGFASYSETKPQIYKLHKIYVIHNQQGKGTGRFVIDQIITNIKALGAKRLQLNVNRNNKAKDFYEKLGFTAIGEEDIDIGNGYFMNDYIMEKEL